MEAAGLGVYNEEQYEYASSSVVDQMPPGFRFHPADWEIIIYYLLNKVIDRLFRAVAIGEMDLNKCEPWDLIPQKAKMGEKEWFFFFEKESKYPSGMRTNRATPSGYWKATGKDKEIYKEKKLLVGMKKTLVFYKGRAPKGEKTNWVIHEYRLQGEFPAYNLSADAKEKWVVCKVFHKKTSPNVELSRIDSFNVDRYLLDSPTTLPPLIDDSACNEKPNSCDGDDFKPPICPSTKINKSQELQQHYSQNNLNPVVFPYHSPSLTYQHLDGLMNFPIQGADNYPNSGIVAPEEPISFSNSAICNEINGGKESEGKKPCDEGQCFSPTISDLDSLWSY